MRVHPFVLTLLVSLVITTLSHAQPAPAATPPTRLKVGVFDKPPFAIKDEDGHWNGLGVDLWERIARDLNLTYDYVEVPVDDLVPKLVKGELDLVVGELGVSAEREKLIDFTQPYLTSASAVAVLPNSQAPLWKDISVNLAQHGVGIILGSMLVTLIVFSLLLWFAERRVQRGHFGGRPIHGLGSAIWFAAVTMTTVGYGDKTPQTPLGRALAFLWMFSGILLVGAFTGAIASSFTLSGLHAKVNRVGDLIRYQNGVQEGSISQDVMNSLGVPAQRFPTAEAGLAALGKGQITAFVATDATLRYLNQHDFDGRFDIVSLPTTRISFAMATRPNFPLLQDINVSLIKITSHYKWQREIDTWLGSASTK